MRRINATLLTALALMPCATASAAPAAMAAPAPAITTVVAATASGGQAAQAGDKLGKLITGWGKAILLAVAGFMAIGALIERHVGKALTIFMLALLAGSFLYAPDNMGNFVTNVANSLFG
jgi:hypothetical protein